MKALVVHESMFGNTSQVAEAIGHGLELSMEVDVVAVAAQVSIGPDVGLLVVGGPTHAFSMTRASTRAEAVSKGAQPPSADVGIREWLDDLVTGAGPVLVATFDTRMEKVRHLPGSAARRAARVLHRLGHDAVAPAESFYVLGTDGPLLDGELERARTWGEHLATLCEPSTSPV